MPMRIAGRRCCRPPTGTAGLHRGVSEWPHHRLLTSQHPRHPGRTGTARRAPADPRWRHNAPGRPVHHHARHQRSEAVGSPVGPVVASKGVQRLIDIRAGHPGRLGRRSPEILVVAPATLMVETGDPEFRAHMFEGGVGASPHMLASLICGLGRRGGVRRPSFACGLRWQRLRRLERRPISMQKKHSRHLAGAWSHVVAQ